MEQGSCPSIAKVGWGLSLIYLGATIDDQGPRGFATSLDIPLSPHLGRQQFYVAYVGPYGLKLLSDSDKLCILCAYEICREEKP